MLASSPPKPNQPSSTIAQSSKCLEHVTSTFRCPGVGQHRGTHPDKCQCSAFSCSEQVSGGTHCFCHKQNSETSSSFCGEGGQLSPLRCKRSQDCTQEWFVPVQDSETGCCGYTSGQTLFPVSEVEAQSDPILLHGDSQGCLHGDHRSERFLSPLHAPPRQPTVDGLSAEREILPVPSHNVQIQDLSFCCSQNLSGTCKDPSSPVPRSVHSGVGRRLSNDSFFSSLSGPYGSRFHSPLLRESGFQDCLSQVQIDSNSESGVHGPQNRLDDLHAVHNRSKKGKGTRSHRKHNCSLALRECHSLATCQSDGDANFSGTSVGHCQDCQPSTKTLEDSETYMDVGFLRGGSTNDNRNPDLSLDSDLREQWEAILPPSTNQDRCLRCFQVRMLDGMGICDRCRGRYNLSGKPVQRRDSNVLHCSTGTLGFHGGNTDFPQPEGDSEGQHNPASHRQCGGSLCSKEGGKQERFSGLNSKKGRSSSPTERSAFVESSLHPISNKSSRHSFSSQRSGILDDVTLGSVTSAEHCSPPRHGSVRLQSVSGCSLLLLNDPLSKQCRRQCICKNLATESVDVSPSEYNRTSISNSLRISNTCPGRCAVLEMSVVTTPVTWKRLAAHFGLDVRNNASTSRLFNRTVTDFIDKMDSSLVLPEPLCDPLEPSTRASYLTICAAFDSWACERNYCAFPATNAVLSEYVRSKLAHGLGAAALSVISAVRRIHKDLGLTPPVVDQSVVTAARKVPRKLPDVQPFPMSLAIHAWETSSSSTKFYAVIAALACRLMLRPGEIGKILLSDVHLAQSGVWVRLRARKSDKILKRNPWHLLSCSSDSIRTFCLPCAVYLLCIARYENGTDTSPLFADAKEFPLPPGIMGTIFNFIAAAVDPSMGSRFTGKSGRVGGAISAALGGAPELVICTCGDWHSDTIRRYIAGIMASKTELFSLMVSPGTMTQP